MNVSSVEKVGVCITPGVALAGQALPGRGRACVSLCEPACFHGWVGGAGAQTVGF